MGRPVGPSPALKGFCESCQGAATSATPAYAGRAKGVRATRATSEGALTRTRRQGGTSGVGTTNGGRPWFFRRGAGSSSGSALSNEARQGRCQANSSTPPAPLTKERSKVLHGSTQCQTVCGGSGSALYASRVSGCGTGCGVVCGTVFCHL